MWKALTALLGAALSLPVSAATFVYVSNADDGDIGMYTLRTDGSAAGRAALQGRRQS